MLFSEDWLRSYINPDLTTEELAESLTMAGLEVEEVQKIAPDFTGVVVGHVLECVDHENSDHLHVTKVNVGNGEILQIVCGAPNVRAGPKVACAKIGAVLPEFKIKKAKMRGVESFGMLCSARELGVSSDHTGIWELPADAPVGEDVRKVLHLDDSRFEIKLTPNRGDALSVVGVARDLHAVTGAPLTIPAMPSVEATCSCTEPVHIEAPELCGRFTGRVIRGLNAKAPTPQWMKDRLERSGQRSISALVDISNYVMLELGRPTHFFDLKKVKGDLTVRWAKDGETIKILNEETVKLDPYYGVICDENGPEAIAGIMGGDATAISDETTDIFIEAAFWYPVKIQGRCRKLNFSTDAAHRFERGVDYGSNVEHMHYITQLVLDICGTAETKVGPVDDQCVNLPKVRTVCMRPARCNKLVGIDIPTDFMAQAFTRLGFEFTHDGEDFVVTSPTYRFDIEIEEDLVEEVARLYGYEKLPDRPPLARIGMRCAPEASRSKHALRLALAERGYQELINFSFVEEKWEKDFAGNDKPIRLLNPIASQLSVMRTQLISGLVDILRFNLNRKAEDVRVFELGRVFFPDETVEDGDFTVKGVRQPNHIAGLAYGDAHTLQWGEAARNVDFFDVKGDVEALIAPLKATFEKLVHPALHPGRSARILINGREAGFMGELHPRLCHEYGLPKPAVVFELDVDALTTILVPHPVAVSKFQPMHRDISVTVPAAVEASALFAAVEKLKATNLGSVIDDFRLFDVYRPKDDAAAAEKSMAFRLTLSSKSEEALSDESADAVVTAVLDALSVLGCRLRA